MPQERNAASFSGAGIAATAHWVSWPAAAMTLAPWYSPTTVPLFTRGANSSWGMWKAESTGWLQLWERGSSSWLVEAMVVSQVWAPHRAQANKSGINSSRWAFSHSWGSCRCRASSWYRLLMFKIWVPVAP